MIDVKTINWPSFFSIHRTREWRLSFRCIDWLIINWHTVFQHPQNEGMKHLTEIVREYLTEPNSKVKAKDLVNYIITVSSYYESSISLLIQKYHKSLYIHLFSGEQRSGCECDELHPGKDFWKPCLFWLNIDYFICIGFSGFSDPFV